MGKRKARRLLRKAKRNKGFHLPDYNYCGPGTVDLGADPINRIDAACKRHDEDPDFDYFYYNDADEKLLQEVDLYKEDDPVAASIISGVFGTKKRFVPKRNNRAPYIEKEEKFTQDSLTNDSGESTQQTQGYNTSLGRTSRSVKTMGFRKKRSYSRRKASKSSFRRKRNFKRSKKVTPKSLARLINPDRTWELNNQVGCICNVSNSRPKCTWIDPHTMPTSAALTAPDDYAMMNISNLQVRMGDLFSGTWTSGVANAEMWFLGGKETFTFHNHSNTEMKFIVYKLQNYIRTSVTPIDMMDDSTLDTDIYTGLATTSLIDAETAGREQIKQGNKMMSIYDFKNMRKYWKIVGSKKYTLQQSESAKYTLKHKGRLIRNEYMASSEYHPGFTRILVRVDPQMTAANDTTYPPVGTTAYVSQASQQLFIQMFLKMKMAKKMEQGRTNYVAEVVTANWKDTPVTIGESTAGTDIAATD